jgi:glycosyltransferase involved in cell wall biosynthesis
MDFVTITDEDSIDGCLEIAHLPDAFVSVKLTASFEHSEQAIQLLCFGVTPEDHEWLQHHRDSVHEVAGYLADRGIAAALAHPFRTITVPLTPGQRQTLGTLFGLWETRNGSQPHEINAPAAAIVESIGRGAIAGSGDRTGETVGTTWTTTPYAATTEELLGHLRAYRARPHGIERTAPAPSPHAGHAYAFARRALTDPPMLAMVVTGDIADLALARTLDELRARGVPGHAIEFTETLTRPRGEVIHLCGSGEAIERAVRIAESAGVPLVSSFGSGVDQHSRLVLSPSKAADEQLITLGIDPIRIRRWELAANPERFSSARYHGAGDGTAARINLLYSGPLDPEHESELLSDAFQLAHDRDPRLHLVLAGAGPDEELLRRRLGGTATFLGRLEGDALAQAYASANLLVCPNADGYGQLILDAQASGLPVLAVGDGVAAELIQSGRNGCLVPATTLALAEAMGSLARRATLRERLTTGGLLATRERTWERSLRQLAAAWSDARHAAPCTCPAR